MSFDIRTLAVVAAVAAVLQAVALAALWRTAPRARGTREWAAGGCMMAVGMMLIALRALVPEFLSVVIANLLLVGGHIAYLTGIERFLDRPSSHRAGMAVFAATCLAFLYFTYVDPNIAQRIVAISIALAILAALCAIRIATHPREKRSPINRFLVVVLLLHAGFHTMRGGFTVLDQTLISDFMQASSIHAAAFFDVIIFSFSAGLAFCVLTVTTLNSSLERELEARSELLTIIAHDVRAPFSGLVGLTSMVDLNLEQGRLDEARNFARRVSVSSNEVLGLLEDLILWGWTTFRGDQEHREPLDIGVIADAELERLKLQATDKNLKIKNNSRPFTVTMSPDHARMIMRNLLTNAIKFAPCGSVINIEAVRSADTIELRVENDVGSKADQPSELTGMGVGLKLCARVCAAEGYSLEFNESADKRFLAKLITRENR